MNRTRKEPLGGRTEGLQRTTQTPQQAGFLSAPMIPHQGSSVNTSPTGDLRDAIEYLKMYHQLELKRKDRLLHQVIELAERVTGEMRRCTDALGRTHGGAL